MLSKKANFALEKPPSTVNSLLIGTKPCYESIYNHKLNVWNFLIQKKAIDADNQSTLHAKLALNRFVEVAHNWLVTCIADKQLLKFQQQC